LTHEAERDRGALRGNAARLFFALWPGEGVRARLAQCSRELHALCGGRRTRAQNLHLTLAFLGPVEVESIPAIERAAGEVRPRAARLVLDHPGFWKHNRIAWAGASVVPAELERLVIELRDALSRSRVQFDPKAFAAHVTLLRDARAPDAMPDLEPIPWDLESFALVRSRLQQGGSGYEILNSWKVGS